MKLDQDIQEILISQEDLEQRIEEMAAEITRDYAGKAPLLVGILRGSYIFMADLVRHIDLPISMDFMVVSSYGAGTVSSGLVNIKKDLAAAMPLEEPRSVLVRGINQLSTSAGTIQFSSSQAHEAIQDSCEGIIRAIRWVLERTPPELCADIMRGGIHLTGGASQLFALDQFISEKLDIPVLLAKDPADSCILGIGYLTENIQLVTPPDRRAVPTA